MSWRCLRERKFFTEFNTVLEREGMPEKCRRSEVALIFKNKGPEL